MNFVYLNKDVPEGCMAGCSMEGRPMGTGWSPWTSPHTHFDIVMLFEPHGWRVVRRQHTNEWSWALAATEL